MGRGWFLTPYTADLGPLDTTPNHLFGNLLRDIPYRVVLRNHPTRVLALQHFRPILNTDGGALFVGVRDDGEILGVEPVTNKLHKGKTDKFLLHFRNLVKIKIGQKIIHYPTGS
jgi:hypothetical protein